jgi:hypothetical protein
MITYLCVSIFVWVLQRRRKEEDMGNLQRWEAACGLVAALFGLLGLAYALFGPVYRFESSSGQSGTANLVQVGIPPSALIALGILVLGLIGVAVSAVVHSRTGGSGWRIVLWLSTAVIVILTFLTLPSIGAFLLPSTLFALLASALSLGARRATLS